MNVERGWRGAVGRGRGGARLLLAEDDAELAGMLVELFAGEGYAVDAVYDGQSALHRALNRAYEVAVFDRGLSHVEGLELLSRLRRAGWATPVLVLSAYGAARDRVAGRTVELSARESALLGVLAGRPGRVFPREELLDRVFPPLRSRTWSIPTCPICAASWVAASSVPCTVSDISSAACRGSTRRRSELVLSRLRRSPPEWAGRGDRDRALVRSAGRRAAGQAAILVAESFLLCGGLVLLVVITAQRHAADSDLRAAVSRAEDVTDPPQGISLLLRRPDGSVAATPGAGSGDVHTPAGEFRVRTQRRPTAAGVVLVQAALSLQPGHTERARLLAALTPAAGVALLAAAGLGAVTGRHRPAE